MWVILIAHHELYNISLYSTVSPEIRKNFPKKSIFRILTYFWIGIFTCKKGMIEHVIVILKARSKIYKMSIRMTYFSEIWKNVQMVRMVLVPKLGRRSFWLGTWKIWKSIVENVLCLKMENVYPYLTLLLKIKVKKNRKNRKKSTFLHNFLHN